ncbi:MAG: hypothetical protein DHS20C01_15200 [marine bacterium B5-7]|nr:MAG: hypothetical protein DHS20C01_15200 [marine bacterium B5-7]
MGATDENLLSRMTSTTLILEAVTAESIYSEPRDISKGLEVLSSASLSRPDQSQIELLRMVNSTIQLQASLRDNETLTGQLGRRLEQLSRKSPPKPYPDDVYFSLNDIYSEILSSLSPRIIVNGEPAHLQSALVVAKIRSALLAAVRNAYLWSESGGRRWHLLFFRKRYADNAKEILG